MCNVNVLTSNNQLICSFYNILYIPFQIAYQIPSTLFPLTSRSCLLNKTGYYILLSVIYFKTCTLHRGVQWSAMFADCEIL